MPAAGRMLKLALLSVFLLFPALHAEKSKCSVCKDMVEHFMGHYNKTKGQNFGGGNTAWEEKSLGTYATSETRLVEILETTAKKCDHKCGSLLEDQEEQLEEWFFKRQGKTDLFEELCVDQLKRCCLKNRWGPDCAECPGGAEQPCSGKGTCRGEGDREVKKGDKSGTCSCEKGYNGTLCDSCKDRYVRVDDTCEECSSLCKSQNCTAPGPKGCVECRMGYEMLEETGCTDIDECKREGMGCGDPLEDCVNSAGSYECVCKTGYKRVDGKCQLEDLYASEDEEDDPVEGAEGKDSQTDGGTDENPEVPENGENSESEEMELPDETSEEVDEEYTEMEDDTVSAENEGSQDAEETVESNEGTKIKDEL